MCDMGMSLMAAAVAMSAASAAVSYTSAQDNAKAQASAAANQQAYAEKVALENTRDQNAALAREQEAAKESAIQESVKAQRERSQVTGRMLTGAAAGGVTGLTVDQSVIGVYQQEADVRSNLARNMDMSNANISAQQLSAERNLRNTQAAPQAAIIQPNASAYMLQFGASALATGSKMYDRGVDKGYWGGTTTGSADAKSATMP